MKYYYIVICFLLSCNNGLDSHVKNKKLIEEVVIFKNEIGNDGNILIYIDEVKVNKYYIEISNNIYYSCDNYVASLKYKGFNILFFYKGANFDNNPFIHEKMNRSNCIPRKADINLRGRRYYFKYFIFENNKLRIMTIND